MERSVSGSEARAGLLGRGVECDRLDTLIEDIRGGQSRSLVLHGEAGIGKTALLDYLVAAAADIEVVRVTGMEAEMELAYAGVHQLCGPLLESLTGIPEPQRHALEIVLGRSAGAVPDRFLVSLAVLSLLAESAEKGPRLGVIDDVQWLDRASVLTLTFVARRLLAERVGLVFATRELGDALRHLPLLQVEGLHTDAARALLSSGLTFALDQRVRARIIAETRGNPLALLELPHGLSATELAGGFGIPSTEALSGPIEKSYARRIEAMPPQAQTLMLLAAAEPTGDALLLRRAAEDLGIEAPTAELVTEEGLVTIGNRVVFRHPLVRSAIYRSATAAARGAVHRALARATDAQVDPDRRAWHLAAAAEGPDDEIASELERSAGRAQARAGLAAAAAFLERAVTLTGDPAKRADRALAATDACVSAGAFDHARSLIAVAEECELDELQRARVELMRGQLSLYVRPGSEVPPLLVSAARRLESLDAELARDTYLDAWSAGVFAGRLANACDIREVCRAARSAPPLDGPRRPADLLLEAVTALSIDGRRAAAPLLEAAARTFVDDDCPLEVSLRWGWVAPAPGYLLWDEERTHTHFDELIRVHRETGAHARLRVILSTYSLHAARCGDFRTVEAAIGELEAMVSGRSGSAHLTLPRMILAAFRGDNEAARALIEGVSEGSRALGQGLGIQVAEWMLAVLCNGYGRFEETLPAAHRASDDSPELWVSAWATPELLEAAVRTGRSEIARDALERINASTEVARTESAAGIRARSHALLSEGELAEKLYLESIERLARTRLRPELARAHLLYGEWLRNEQRRADALAQLRAAHDQFTSLGMQGFAERARAELGTVGVRTRAKVVESREELTAQERQIARLAAERLSNPEIGARLFLSPRTVEWHLHKVFTKLGIRSRRELADALPETA